MAAPVQGRLDCRLIMHVNLVGLLSRAWFCKPQGPCHRGGCLCMHARSCSRTVTCRWPQGLPFRCSTHAPPHPPSLRSQTSNRTAPRGLVDPPCTTRWRPQAGGRPAGGPPHVPDGVHHDRERPLYQGGQHRGAGVRLPGDGAGTDQVDGRDGGAAGPGGHPDRGESRAGADGLPGGRGLQGWAAQGRESLPGGGLIVCWPWRGKAN